MITAGFSMYIEKNMFENLKYLKKLDLRSNKLEKLDPESFIGLENLKELNLSSNKLVDFDFGILDKLYIIYIYRYFLK